jgi:hypothetical protein
VPATGDLKRRPYRCQLSFYSSFIAYGGLEKAPVNSRLGPGFITNPPEPILFTNNVQTTTRFNGNIVRVGLNYPPY